MIKRVIAFIFGDKEPIRHNPIRLVDLPPLDKKISRQLIRQMAQTVPCLDMIPMEKAPAKRKKRQPKKKAKR